MSSSPLSPRVPWLSAGATRTLEVTAPKVRKALAVKRAPGSAERSATNAAAAVQTVRRRQRHRQFGADSGTVSSAQTAA
eukprot:813642-Prorocentrum_minimum.AAC.1